MTRDQLHELAERLPDGAALTLPKAALLEALRPTGDGGPSSAETGIREPSPEILAAAARTSDAVLRVGIVSACLLVAAVRIAIFGPYALAVWRIVGMLALVGAVVTLPHFAVESLATFVVKRAELEAHTHKRGFTNPSAFLGLFERPLLLLSLVAGFPAFWALWFGLKAVSKWQHWDTTPAGRRVFGVYLLNNAVSIASVGFGLLLWFLLGFPRRP